FLQREVAQRMFQRLEYIKLEPKRIVDAGCGTGHDASKLASRYPKANLIALDLAENMLRASPIAAPWWKRHLPLLGGQSIHYVCADMEKLPLASNSVGLVWSNLALPWVDLGRSVAEFHRVLAVDGLIMFSTLGPDTLKELREAFAGLDRYQHVNRFIDMHDIGDALVHAGFADPVMDMEIITVTFGDIAAMVNDLKSLGMRNRLVGRRPGLMTPAQWRQVAAHYEAQRRDGKLPVTIEVVYGHAWKPQPKTTSDGRQVIQFRDRPGNG
nr:malonyl-ACP O-methyltransferase BioC [Burkholderiales bacterium]